ncbi:MAG: C1 family peptidase [Planctomycetota bacterium]
MRTSSGRHAIAVLLLSGLIAALAPLATLSAQQPAQPRHNTSRNTGSANQGEDIVVPAGTTLPATFSLRPWMTPVQDQQRRGTCVAFALCACLEYLYQRDLSEQYAYYVAEQADGDDKQGLSGIKALQVLCDKGTVEARYWPYNGEKIAEGGRADGGPPPATITDNVRRFKVSQFRFVPDASIDGMRYAIAVLNRPVMVSLPIDWECGWRDGDINMPRENFAGQSGEAEADLENQVQGVNHAVLIVGYLHEQRRFIMRNSWGEDTAYAGYYTVPYAYVTRYTRYAFICNGESPVVRVDADRAQADDYRLVELTRFRVDEGRYQFREDLVVGPKQSLVVPPGSTLTFAAGTGLKCFGSIDCTGTEAKPIRFTGDKWSGVRVDTRRGRANLTWCVIDGGASDDGGCLRVGGGSQVVARNCTLRGGRATRGGAIFTLGGRSKETHESYDSSVTLDACQIIGCVATDNGGAIHANASSAITCTNSVFTDNTARSGGAIILIGGESGAVPGTFTGCTFRGNQASESGGAINVNSASLGTINACTFETNSAGNDGGAVVCIGDDNRPAKIMMGAGCRFVGNHAGDMGGALMATHAVDVQIEGARFEANATVTDGGAVALYGSEVTIGRMRITRCEFANNVADRSGGHIRVGHKAEMSLTGCSFDGGSAKDNSGAVHVNGLGGKTAILRAEDCTFRDMRATSGGAMNVNLFGEVRMTRCQFARTASERGGGAIWTVGRVESPCKLSLTDCEFVQCNAGGTGAINAGPGTALTLDNCRFERCVAGAGAGGLAVAGGDDATSTARVDRSTFTSCNAAHSGGAVQVLAAATALFTNCTFDGNRTSQGGGAVCLSGLKPERLATGIFRDCTFSANVASAANQSGGALYVRPFSAGQFDRCTFSSNVSSQAGGALFLTGDRAKATEVVFNDCRIEANRAGQFAGGVMVHKRVDVRFSRCNFATNRSGKQDGNGITCDATVTDPIVLIYTDSTFDREDGVRVSENVTVRR